MKSILRDALAKLARHENLTEEESYRAFAEILETDISELQVAGFLGLLRGKGESAEEILGCVRTLRDKSLTVATRHELVVDTCGTGGDNAHTFNISTAAAFVAAGCGLAVAKHGNRSVSSRCGSADVLEILGVAPDVEPPVAEQALNELGIAFLFAPRYHPALKKMAALRRQLGFKTIFNIAGPLANPIRSRRSAQVVGVFEKRLVPIVAEVLKKLKLEKAWVVHSLDGLDEISTEAPTAVAALEKGAIALQEVKPEDAGIARSPLAELRGATPEDNARILLEVLEGKKGSPRNAVVLNAAAACLIGGKAVSYPEAVKRAEESLDSGKARETFLKYKNFIQKQKR